MEQNKYAVGPVNYENYVTCPYNSAHRIMPTRLAKHLISCGGDRSLHRCPFNSTHLLSAAAMKVSSPQLKSTGWQHLVFPIFRIMSSSAPTAVPWSATRCRTLCRRRSPKPTNFWSRLRRTGTPSLRPRPTIPKSTARLIMLYWIPREIHRPLAANFASANANASWRTTSFRYQVLQQLKPFNK